MVVEEGTNIATYQPAENFNGEDSFTFIASDGLLTSDSAIVTISVSAINDAPVITGVPSSQIVSGAAYSFTPEATDVEEDTLSFSVQNNPDWLILDRSTGSLTGAPTDTDIGLTENIILTVTDGELNSSLEAFSIEVIEDDTNNAPVAESQFVSTDEDVPVLITLVATDADDDSLAYRIEQDPAQGTVSQDGNLLTYTPNSNVGDVGTAFNFLPVMV